MARGVDGRGANGVRLNPEHDARTRARIQTTQLINRLQMFINSKVELQPAQVTAALGLLKKVLPDTVFVEHAGEVTTRVIRAPPAIKTPEEWEQTYVPPQHRTEH